YINAGMPNLSIYKNKKTQLLKKDKSFPAIGEESSLANSEVSRYHLGEGEMVFLVSGGIKNFELFEEEKINYERYETEELFGIFVEKSEGELEKLKQKILQTGEPKEDLSVMKIHFIKTKFSD
ncbi:MAG: SpoIIE family protein phosphatase, partial [Leptospiraceae bacterium]|nr:SpoIIE family protein phosphatase [Leptospiraceae bacterium]